MIGTAKISCEPWGTLPGGQTVHLFTLCNARGMRVAVSDLGATLVSWHAPDRAGRFGDILLGHATPTEYWQAKTYMGALVGRWANRIAGARFTLEGVAYAVDRNEGENLLHGGTTGFHRAIWRVREEAGVLLLRLDSAAGDAGFPGNVQVEVRYALDDEGALTIDYRACSDAPTPLNLTSHGYFNLTAQPGADIRGHLLSIDADAFLGVDSALIPIGHVAVAGSAFDFREAAPIGARLDEPHEQLSLARGFDHCYVLREGGAAGSARPVREVARLYEPESGRSMVVSTDQRGLQLYTGNYLEGAIGRDPYPYARHGGLCLEAGAFPNQINTTADRETVITRADKPYRQVTQYRVGVLG